MTDILTVIDHHPVMTVFIIGFIVISIYEVIELIVRRKNEKY